MPNPREEEVLTQAELKDLFHYEPETGIFTEKTVRSHHNKIGDELKGHGEKGRYSVRIDNVYYGLNRLAFLYMQGRYPKYYAKQLNGDEHDNRWGNLIDVEK